MQSALNVFKKILNDPVYAIKIMMALLRGTYYIIYYKIFRENVHIKFPFKAGARVIIIGSGSVTIGNNCFVDEGLFRGLTIVTLSPDASVSIGNNCNLQGLTIRCRTSVEMKNNTMSAYSLVQDTLFINLDKTGEQLNELDIPISKAIIIEKNVWLAMQTCTLNGCNFGSNSVLSAGSFCYNYKSDKDSLIIGNPAKRSLPISKILKMRVKNG